MLYHLVYKSRCHTGTSKSELEALRTQFDASNRTLDITGVLLCDGVYFMQVLEGRRAVLETLYQKITVDRRHLEVTKLLTAPVPKRIFNDCGMHLIVTRPGHWIDPGELAPLFQVGADGSNEDRTHAILRAFTSGRWRERTVHRFQPQASQVSLSSKNEGLPRVVPFDDQMACFAFQPIVDPISQKITAVEALLRGHDGAPPDVVLSRYTGHKRHLFDFQSKASAFALAQRLKIDCPLSINLQPSSLLSVDNAAELLLAEAARHGFGPRDLIVELTEEEAISNPEQFMQATDALRAAGIAIAIDDFGAGFAGLSLLATFQPDKLKIDRSLVSGVHSDGPRQAILRAIVDCCVSLGIKLVCEGVETEAELRWLLEHEIHDFQGFLFARPLKAGIPDIHWPVLDTDSAASEPESLLQLRGRDSVSAPTHEQVDAAVADPVRLRGVHSLGLLDTPPDEVFQRMVRLAAKLTRAPVAFLALVDKDRDFYVAASGLDEPLASRRQLEGRTFCHYALLSDGPLILEDVTAQDVFRDVPTVQMLGIRAYAGVPLMLPGGETVGSFCAIDFQPRHWTVTDMEVLAEMAQSALREFALRTFNKNRLSPIP